MPTHSPDIPSGGEGTFILDGVDVGVTNWTDNSTYNLVDISTTKDWNATKGINRTRKKAVSVTDDIQFDAFCDLNNDILATLEGATNPGEVGPVVINFRATAKSRTYPLIILKTISRKSGGIAGVNSYSVTAESQGDHPN